MFSFSNHRRIAVTLVLLAGLSPIACLQHDARAVLAIASATGGRPLPFQSHTSDCNESGCMCRGATVCEVATADAWLPLAIEFLLAPALNEICVGQWQPSEEIASLVPDEPAPLSGKMLRAHCASWLL